MPYRGGIVVGEPRVQHASFRGGSVKAAVKSLAAGDALQPDQARKRGAGFAARGLALRLLRPMRPCGKS